MYYNLFQFPFAELNSPNTNGRARLNGLVASPSHSSINQHRVPTDVHGWIRIPDVQPGHHPHGPVYGYGEPGLSGIAHGSYPVVHVSDFIFYQAGPRDFRIIKGSLPVVVRGNYIVGRFDNGYLRPILNNKLNIIKVHRTDNIQVPITLEEYKIFGINHPITRENTINYRPTQPETIVLDD